jgi:hypothetical protein
MTTIGFGDLSPTTFTGKIITTTICYLGVAFWCLPSGIIGSVCNNYVFFFSSIISFLYYFEGSCYKSSRTKT